MRWRPSSDRTNSEMRQLHKMTNKQALFLTITLLIVTTIALYLVYSYSQWGSKGIFFILVIFGAGMLLCSIFLMYRISKGETDKPFDEKSHPMHRHQNLWSDELTKQFDYFCPKCLYQTNVYVKKCPECNGGKLKKTTGR